MKRNDIQQYFRTGKILHVSSIRSFEGNVRTGLIYRLFGAAQESSNLSYKKLSISCNLS